MTSSIVRFCELYDVWEEAVPHVDLLFTSQEIQLILDMNGEALTLDEITARRGPDAASTPSLVESAWRRRVIDHVRGEDPRRYEQAPFSERLDTFVKNEHWDQIPEVDRRRLDRHFLDVFIARHRDNVERMKRGEDAVGMVPNDALLLLEEALDMVRSAEAFAVQPCDCRKLGEACKRPVDVCLALDDAARGLLARGEGRELDREEALDVIKLADKKGLMHTGDPDWRDHELLYVCNCCACDCYPFRAAHELESKGLWPKSRYIAVHDVGKCTLCGKCVTRCHFDAFVRSDERKDIKGKQRRVVHYVPELCWGCGLCVERCPDGAITMKPL